MRAVAIETVLSNIRMLVQERTSLFCMALYTGFLNCILTQIPAPEAPMGIVAVNTEYPSFFKGMMARQGELGLGSMMAAETKFTGSKRCYF